MKTSLQYLLCIYIHIKYCSEHVYVMLYMYEECQGKNKYITPILHTDVTVAPPLLIRCTLLVLLAPFSLITALSLCRIDSTGCLKYSSPQRHYSITRLLQICWLHIQNVNLSSDHIPQVLYLTEIW